MKRNKNALPEHIQKQLDANHEHLPILPRQGSVLPMFDVSFGKELLQPGQVVNIDTNAFQKDTGAS